MDHRYKESKRERNRDRDRDRQTEDEEEEEEENEVVSKVCVYVCMRERVDYLLKGPLFVV